MKIVFIEPVGLSNSLKVSFTKEMKREGHEVVMYDNIEYNPDKLKARIADAQVLVVANQKLSEEVIAAAPNLEFISVAFTGVDHLPTDYCRHKGITISNAAGYSTNAVAELTIASAIDLLRKVVPFDSTTRNGGTRAGFLGNELHGKTFGLFGFGAIATRVADLAQAFGCKIISHCRSIKVHPGVEFVSIDELFQNSDIVSLHIPANQTTKGIVDSKLIALMKPTSVLINTARGTVIDYLALSKALNDGKIAGAAIDVYETEPPLMKEHPMLSAPNTLLLPHIGFATEEAIAIRSQIVIENIVSWLKKSPINVVVL